MQPVKSWFPPRWEGSCPLKKKLWSKVTEELLVLEQHWEHTFQEEGTWHARALRICSQVWSSLACAMGRLHCLAATEHSLSQLCRYLVALCFLLAPLEQGVPLGASIFSCQGRQGILPFFPRNKARRVYNTKEIGIYKGLNRRTNSWHTGSSRIQHFWLKNRTHRNTCKRLLS